ncbi:uncharacterized protein LOC122536079 isoform X2 [Frieseomelitta varia]|uniref:uncharacterized protein LOC122536079 isoform X2 n=1 Tax=Frieseomelitta varia TaxID=561572 RepID=UPI001CB6A185|nr:uncharacterized protein LOC122536079 isoform X2 [Frieseomelitta varia]
MKLHSTGKRGTLTRGIILRMMGNPRGRWRERHDWNDISLARDGARSSHASRSSPAPPVAPGDSSTMRSSNIEILLGSRRLENVARLSTNDDDDDEHGQADYPTAVFLSTLASRSCPVR